MYPTFNSEGSTSLDQLVSLAIDDFFQTKSPSEWTPANYASHPQTTTLDHFEKGLYTIKRNIRGALGTFAAECYQYLRTEDGKRLLEDASTALELRRTHERLGTSELRYSAEVKSNFFDKKLRRDVDIKQGLPRKRKAFSQFFIDTSRLLIMTGCSKDAFHGNFNLTQGFMTLQRSGVKVVTEASSLQLEFLQYFLAVNSIWDLRQPLPNMSKDIHTAIGEQFRRRFPLAAISASENILHLELEEELRALKKIIGNLDSVIPDRPIGSIWKRLSETLRTTWHSAIDRKGEDTHVHHRLNPFVCPIFPGSEYDVVWANKQLGGSQARREDDSKEGYRPDLVIKREGVTFLIGEVKPPEHDTSLDDYTQDLWKLLIMMKDELDHMLDAGYDHEFMFGLHIFGYKVDLWVLRLEIEGVYQLYHVGEACLPRYQLDTSGVKYVCQLFFSVKDFVTQNLLTSTLPSGLRTPPKRAEYTRATAFTPSKRQKQQDKKDSSV